MEASYQREEVKRMRDNIGDLRGKLGDLEAKNALLEKEVQNLNYQVLAVFSGKFKAIYYRIFLQVDNQLT